MHVTCNNIPTPYRVLIDMSDVIGSVEPQGNGTDIKVTVRFAGAELDTSILLSCALISPCPISPSSIPDIFPEAGMYGSEGLDKQGLLLARQKQRMAAFPLIYDSSGSSEWLFAPDRIVQDVFFSTLYESTGGQCPGCPPPGNPPELNVVGKLTLLMDNQGLVQMKINNGLFISFQQSEFGYGSIDIGGSPNRRVPDLSGRWAFVEDMGKVPQSTPEETPIVPLVFDITLKSVVDIPIVGSSLPSLPGYVMFSVRDKEGDEVAQMQCDYGSDVNNVHAAQMVCNMNNPDINDGLTLYEVKPLSLERLSFSWTGPMIPEIPANMRIAVRVD